MPELFGSPYILPAIIAVVLLLLLIVLLAAKRRTAKTPPSRADKIPQSVPKTQGQQIKSDPAQRPQRPERPKVTPAPSQKTVVSARRPSEGDPLIAVIDDILRGWGDVIPEDTRRLDVFKTDRVVAALEKARPLGGGKNGDHSRNRLAQLRHYAQSLPSGAQHPAAGEGDAVDATVTGAAELNAALPSESDEPSPHAEPQGILELEPAKGEEVTDSEWDAPSDDSPPNFWTDPNGAFRLEDASPDVSALTVEPEEDPTAEVPGKSYDVNDFFAPQNLAPVDSLSSLHLQVKTADDLMSLPVFERVDNVVFLEPPELSKVFEATNDPALKKSIIDMLEHVGTPSSLEVLRRCLDDADQEIQVYALEAADRLLGVD